MSGFRNVYKRGDLVFVGRYHATYQAANEAHAAELGYEGAAALLAVATDTSGPAWEDELRALGRIFGVTDTEASAEAIGDAITSQRDTLRNALRYIGDQTMHLHGLAHVSGAALSALRETEGRQ